MGRCMNCSIVAEAEILKTPPGGFNSSCMALQNRYFRPASANPAGPGNSETISRVIRISIDAMGGDHGPAVVLPALNRVIERRPDVRFLIFGRENEVAAGPGRAIPKVAAASTFVHCEIAVRMDDKPSQALRHGRWKSSMWKAVEAVKTGDADFCVSAGNTGALMAMSKFCLRTMSKHRASGDRRDLADAARRKRRARRRRDHRRRRPPADRLRHPRRRHGARAVRRRAADRRPAQCRRRGDQGPGGGQGGRPRAARGRL